jgi:4a-hydroxytetrahydrobiopterin dehydratase
MWKNESGRLSKEFIFQDFSEAFSFMTRVSFIAEKMDHHPDWSNCWNRVNIHLSTHDAGDIVTDKDIEMARKIDSLIQK